MAAAENLPILSFDYIAYIEELKGEVIWRTEKLISEAIEQKMELLNKLSELIDQFKENQDRISEELDSIGSLLNSSRETASLEELDQTMREVQERRDSLREFTRFKYVRIRWQPKLVDSIRNYGTISIEDGPKYAPSSENKSSKCLDQEGITRMNPSALTIDPIRKELYLTDATADCVFVFSSEGQYLRQFGQGIMSFWRGMDEPRGISIQDTRIFVTQSNSHCLKEFRMDGMLTATVGQQGPSPRQFNRPLGIESEPGYVYVCDSYNHRIQVLDGTLGFVKRFILNDFRYPRQLKLLEKHLFVLTSSSCCIQEIDKQDGSWVRSIVERGESLDMRKLAFSFDIAHTNIIVCDSSSKSVSFLSHNSTKLLHNCQFPDELELRCVATLQGDVYVVVRDVTGKTQLICINWDK